MKIKIFDRKFDTKLEKYKNEKFSTTIHSILTQPIQNNFVNFTKS